MPSGLRHRARLAHHTTARPSLESLEQRIQPSVTPLTLAHPSFWTAAGTEASSKPSISADGQLVVFQSDADNLVPNDTNNQTDVFLYNRGTGRVSLLSVDNSGAKSGGNASSSPRITPDGRFVVFLSSANDLTPTAGNGFTHVYVRDLATNTTTLVSQDTAGAWPNQNSSEPTISDDGRVVTFASFASDLVPNDTNNRGDVFARFWRDPTPSTLRVSAPAAGGSDLTHDAYGPVVSGNGNVVVFATHRGLFALDTNDIDDTYAFDLTTNTLKLVSIDTTQGFAANAHAGTMTDQPVSADGRYVVFWSGASNLVSGTSGRNAFVRDLLFDNGPGNPAGKTFVINRARAAGGTDGYNVAITPDGKHASWLSNSNNTLSDVVVTGGFAQAYLSDLTDLNAITTKLISVNRTGTNGGDSTVAANIPRDVPRMSPDGRYVAFASLATDHVNGVANNNGTTSSTGYDVYLRDMQTGFTRFVSVSPSGLLGGDDLSYLPAINDPLLSGGHPVVAFQSEASNLGGVADGNGVLDILVRDATAGVTELASRKFENFPAAQLSTGELSSLEDVTPDGRFVAIQTNQIDLTTGLGFNDAFDGRVLVLDRDTGLWENVTVTPAGGFGRAQGPARLSDDGRYVFFSSDRNLDPAVDGLGKYQLYRRDRVTGTTRMVTVSTDPTKGANTAWFFTSTISADGRYVAWMDEATNLVPGFVDGNGTGFQFGAHDIFVRDMATGVTRLVSHVQGGLATSGNGFSFSPTMSKDGSKIIFLSRATNLLSGLTDTNNDTDVYAYDIATQGVSLVSVSATPAATGNTGSNSNGSPLQVSDDGRYVTFVSSATNLPVPGNGYAQVYRRDLVTGTTIMVSVSPSGAAGSNSSAVPFLTPDGKKVVFQSRAQNLTSEAFGTVLDQVFLRDLSGATPVTTLVSVNSAGTTHPNNSSHVSVGNRAGARVTADGRYVVFESYATNLVAGFVDANGNNATDLYLRDLENGRTSLVSYNGSGTAGVNRGVTAGEQGHGGAYILLPSGPTIIFDSPASDHLAGDSNSRADLFAYTHQGDGSIAGNVFNDLDASGARNGSESGLGYQLVYLDANGNSRYDVGEPNVLTDANGDYRLTNLAAGTYRVGLVLQSGNERTTAAFHQVTLAMPTSAATGIEFGSRATPQDLSIDSVTIPTAINPGANALVRWVTRNAGSAAITSAWQDAVYLSADNVLSADDVLLATVPHTGTLVAGGVEYGTATVMMPSVEGTYHVIVVADRRRQLADTNRDNNLAVTLTPVTVSLPVLTPGVPFADAFAFRGQLLYYKVTVPAGVSLVVSLDSAATTGGTELYVALGRLPRPGEGDFHDAFLHAARPDNTVTVPQTAPGTYYVLARATVGEAATSPFTLTATVRGFDLLSVDSPNVGAGRVTVPIRGSALKPTTAFSLKQGAATITASSIDFRDAGLVYATFDLTSRSGAFDVVGTDGPNTATLGAAVTVMPMATAGQLHTRVIVPASVRTGRTGVVVVEYENLGSSDIPAPFLSLTATNAVLRLEEQDHFGGTEVQLLGVAQEGPAGVLRPGQKYSVRVVFKSTGQGGVPIGFRLLTLDDPNEVIDWAALKSTIKPAHIPADAWDAIYPNLVAEAGPTKGTYQAMLGRNASYLSNLGIVTADMTRLLSFEISLADSVFTGGSLASVTDAAFPTPGSQLALVRFRQDSIHGRYNVGPFGRGWTHNWDAEAFGVGSGMVVRVGDARRFFSIQADGSYAGQRGDSATLTVAGGKITLIETTSSKWVFDQASGKLDFFESDNGQRVTLGFTAGRLTSLTHTSGATITLRYDSNGRIDRLTDPVGRTVDYGYDATGQHLTSYTDKYGLHTYEYVTGQSVASEHALKSVNFSDDTHVTFTYDTRGRLVREARDGDTVPTVYTYLAGAGYRVADGLGNTATILPDDGGKVRRVIDALGRIANYSFDASDKLVGVELPMGIRYSYSYDVRGNLLSSTDALGREAHFSYDTHDNLTSFTDARGKTTTYAYDGQDNPKNITDATGKSELFDYDTKGQVTTATNRRGKAVSYTYDANGQVLTKTFADGSQMTYTYDARARLGTATNASGRITLEYNANDTLKKISYPGNKSLSFEYNVVGQRTRSVDQDGFTTNYTYDDLGRLQKVSDGAGALVVEYQSDAAGRLTLETKGNGTKTTYQYDDVGQLLRIENLKPDNSINSFFQFAYDALGRRTSMQTADGTTGYQYDAIGQLTKVTLPGGRTIEYQYDAAGNRTRVIDSQLGTTNYVVNDLNQYVAVGGTSYTYDADGNLATKSDATGTTTFAFDVENRLVDVTGPGTTANYGYDALGFRDQVTVNGATTRYLIDPAGLGNVTAEYNGNGALMARNQYVPGPGLVSRTEAGGTAYYDFDGTGNTIGMTDASGAYVNRYSYLPFGETTVISAGVTNPFTFVGRFGVKVDVVGTFDMRQRNYEVATGQFLSADPLGLSGQDGNFRRYVGNDPVSWIDPLGLTRYQYTGPSYPTMAGTGNYTPTGHTIMDCNGGPDRPIYADPNGHWFDIPNIQNGVVYPLFDSGPYQNIDPVADAPPPPKDGPVNPPSDDDHTNDPWYFHGPGDPSNAGSGGGGGGCPCGCPPGGGPTGGGGPGGGGTTNPRNAFDPNDITGPAGVGAAGYVSPAAEMPYTIRFENVANAGAAAQEVFVTQQLDADLDWSTFRLDDVGFGDLVVDVAAGRQALSHTVEYHNADGSPLRVTVNASIDMETGIVTWTFRSLNPVTGLLPEGVNDGFLPPNDSTHRGEGFVRYSIRPKAGHGAVIDAQASIVFDTNAPIVTNLFSNTTDSAAPSTTASSPPTSATPSFSVSWSGIDAAGVVSYDVYVSVDDGPFTLWLDDSTATTNSYTGAPGRTYGFAVVATDAVGNAGAPPMSAQTMTVVRSGNLTLRMNGNTVELVDSNTNQVIETRNASDTQPLVLTGGDSSDETLTISGRLSYAGGVRFDAGGGFDRLVIVNAGNVVVSAAAVFVGTNVLLTGVDAQQVSNVPSLTVVGTAGNDAFTVGRPASNRNVVSSSDITPLTFFNVTTLVVNLGNGTNSLTVNGGFGAAGLKNVTVNGGANSDTLTHNGIGLGLPVGRGFYRFNGGADIDTVAGVGNANWTLGTLTPTPSLRSSGGGQILISGVEQGRLTGGAGDNVLDASTFTGTTFLSGQGGNNTLRGGRGFDWVTESDNVNFTLSNSLLVGLGVDMLYGMNGAMLTAGAGNNLFNVSGWSLPAVLDGGAGSDLLVSTNNANLTLTDTRLTRTGTAAITLVGFETARLTGGAGNNVIDASTFSGRTQLSGGAGNDILKASLAGAILLGGAGNDTLIGNAGRDMLFGGAGIDSLSGGDGDDLLIHGTTRSDASWAQLLAIQAEWSRTDLPTAERVARLKGVAAVRLNATTVIDDAFRDSLRGGPGADWFWGKLPPGVADALLDRTEEDFLN